MNSLTDMWQQLPQHISPYVLSIGPFHLRYYSLMYIAAFLTTYFLVMYRVKSEGYEYSKDTIQDYFVWAIIGLLAGARLGYAILYNPGYYLMHPLEIVMPFDLSDGFRFTGISGMSYHGGVVGILLASIIFCHRRKINFWRFADLFCPAIPLGYTFGRIGNFLNGELYGRVTDVAWGMYFPMDPTFELRHPSQLYEAFFEGIFLFVFLWSLRRRKKYEGFYFSLYLIGYGIIRFIIEFFREPDLHLGFVLRALTMGQVLCLLMIFAGVVIMAAKRPHNACA